MDPDATLRRINSALRSRDWEEAREARADLNRWISPRGTRPIRRKMYRR